MEPVAFDATSELVLPYRYVSRWRRYWALAATLLPILWCTVIWWELSRTDAADPNDQRMRNNLTTLLIIVSLLVVLMIWRSLAQRLVVTENGLTIGNFLATYKVPWATIQKITTTDGATIRPGAGTYSERFIETYAVVADDPGPRGIHITSLTTVSTTGLRDNPAVKVLQAVAPPSVPVYGRFRD